MVPAMPKARVQFQGTHMETAMYLECQLSAMDQIRCVEIEEATHQW